ncbi:MAG: gamma-glutamylcyclotransferase [Planctomycetaceae bacterium]|nr:gamma-glutamylcyclotransferase [Planctomycetaceae bacterium]
MDKKTYVFVYGTLKQDHNNSRYLSNSRFLATGTVEGQLLDIGPFPGLIVSNGQKNRVLGEVYEVSTETLARLDKLEGEGFLFGRDAVAVEIEILTNDNGQTGKMDLAAWAYFWLGETDYPIIGSGQWDIKKEW